MASKTLTIGSDLEIARDVIASAEGLGTQTLVREIFKFDGVHYYEKNGNITVTKEITIDAARVNGILDMINLIRMSEGRGQKRATEDTPAAASDLPAAKARERDV